MKRLLLLVAVLTGSYVNANTFSVGAHLSRHYKEPDLQPIHPFISCETEDYGTIMYYNSFGTISIGAYLLGSMPISNQWNFVGKLGLVSGYQPRMTYKSTEYLLPEQLFIGKSNIMLQAAPSLEYVVEGGLILQYQLLGNAAAVGFKLDF